MHPSFLAEGRILPEELFSGEFSLLFLEKIFYGAG